jgi:hypothetical protein
MDFGGPPRLAGKQIAFDGITVVRLGTVVARRCRRPGRA